MSEINTLNKQHKAKQWWILVVIFGVVVLLGVFLVTVTKQSKRHDAEVSAEKTSAIDLYGGLDHVSGETLWVNRAEEELKAHKEATDSLKENYSEESRQLKAQQQLVEALQDHIVLLESKLSDVEIKQTNVFNNLSNAKEAQTGFNEELTDFSEGFRQDTLNLEQASINQHWSKNADTYVPAGSYVQAVLLNGLAVSAAVTAQSEPRPVVMRIVSPGSLPNHQHSQLEECRLIGAAFGDVSSERAYIRLERMSCDHHGEFTDHPVFGYVSGPDGKTGILGKVIMKDGAMMGRAFVGGLFGSLSHTLSASFVNSSTSALGTVNSISGGDAFKVSSADGVSGAMDLYARYNVKRAEQYQPVIEVPAGVTVDVVFHKGFYLDGLRESDPPKLAAKTTHADYDLDTILKGN